MMMYAMRFTVQGLRDALTAAESTVTEPLPHADEYIIQLEVTMVDHGLVDHVHQPSHGMQAWYCMC